MASPSTWRVSGFHELVSTRPNFASFLSVLFVSTEAVKNTSAAAWSSWALKHA